MKHDNKTEIEILDNPLLGVQSQDLIISPGQEIEQKVEIINDIESITELNKQQLAVRRARVELEVDNKKLDAAKKTIDSIDKIINAVADADVLKRVTESINTPLDMKLMAEAAERLTNTLKGLMNPSVADEFGNRKKHKINFMFKSNGPVQAAVQVDTSDD